MSNLQAVEQSLDEERRGRWLAEQRADETDRKLVRAIDALRDEATKSLTILQTATEGIVSFDAEGTILSVNPATEKIFGYKDYELLDANVRSLLPSQEEGPYVDKLDEHFWTVSADEAAVCRKAFGRRADGTVFEMELSGSRVDLGGRLFHTWILRDMTLHRSLERQLAFSQKMESVGQLAAGIAHEINTPIQYVGDNMTFLEGAFRDLNSLLALYEKLYRDCQNDESMKDACSQIEDKIEEIELPFLLDQVPCAIQQSLEGTSRVAKIVRAMREFSHPGSRDKTTADLNREIESTITVSRNEWKYVATMEVDLDSTLPLVPCYPAELNQALLNLIVNAAHACAERKGHSSDLGKITVSTRCDQAGVEIRVADNGNGIPEQVREKIFEPFFTTKPVGKGTGQGLSIVYAVIVEKHGGTIHVETEVGHGTTFIIRLPLQENDL